VSKEEIERSAINRCIQNETILADKRAAVVFQDSGDEACRPLDSHGLLLTYSF